MPTTVSAIRDVAVLQETAARIGTLNAAAEARIAALEKELRLVGERDAELLRQSVSDSNGKNVAAERKALQAKMDDLIRRLTREKTDLAILDEERVRAEAEWKAARNSEEDAALGELHTAILRGVDQWFAELAGVLAEKLEEGETLRQKHAEYQNRFLKRYGKASRGLPVCEQLFWTMRSLAPFTRRPA